MAHYPLNHHLRQTYRFLAGLAAVYLTLVGVIGIARTWGDAFFYRDGGDWVLGLRVNPAASWLYAIVGVVLLASVLLGGNLLHHVALVLGWGLCGLGVLMMAFLQTDANVLNASMANVIVTIVLGLVTLTAGLYGKIGNVAFT
ncbi:DUF4383 domain-containing protein [Actinoplanes sp. CA-030573]|uniref:DUF4383 domain-containing protein n=1 Tax=Actinoplanes sp. CA-030573 TaxID=3239898 RepID=UPI003D8CC414